MTHDKKTVGVVGCGTIGSGIAALLALKGHRTIVFTRSEESRTRAEGKVAERLLSQISLSALAVADGEAMLESIDFTTNPDDLGEVEILIESITEDLAQKQQLFAELEEVVPDGCVLATDTSSFTPSRVFELVSNKRRCVGMHFFNPADLIPLVEIAGCDEEDSDAELLSSLRNWLIDMGKVPVILPGSVPAGYIANRLQAVVLAEACRLIEQHGILPQDIDRVMTSCLGLRWAVSGPIQSADLGGLDVFARLMAEITGEVPESIQGHVSHERLGAKTGEGFYVWQSNLERVLQRRDCWLKQALSSPHRSL